MRIRSFTDKVRGTVSNTSTRRTVTRAGLLLAGAALLASCGSGSSAAPSSTTASSSASASGSGLTFYFVTHGCPTDTFWPPVWNGAIAAGKDLGVTVKVLKINVNQCSSPTAAEVGLFNTAIAAKPNGIAVSILDKTSYSSALSSAQSAGIPVVAVNAAPTNSGKPDANNPYLAYIGQPNFNAGQGSAEEGIKLWQLKSGDTVAVVDHEPTNESLTQRLEGIKSVFGPAGIKIAQINTSDNVSSGGNIVSAALTQNKSIKAILTLGTTGTAESVLGLKSANVTLPIGGMDLDSATVADIKNGTVAFTVDQQPFVEGYMSIVELYMDAKFGAAPEPYSTGPAFLTSKNIAKLAPLVDKTGF